MSREESIRAGIGALYGYSGREADAVVTDSASARQVATIVVDAVLPLIESDALFAAADDIQAMHPGEVKNSVIWLRQRAHMILGGGSEDAKAAAFYEDPANREPVGPPISRKSSRGVRIAKSFDDLKAGQVIAYEVSKGDWVLEEIWYDEDIGLHTDGIREGLTPAFMVSGQVVILREPYDDAPAVEISPGAFIEWDADRGKQWQAHPGEAP